MNQINFKPLSQDHFYLIAHWLNKPHIRKWWSIGFDKTITIKSVEKKLTPRITGIEDIKCYIIEINEIPVGYIQVYDARKFEHEGTLETLSNYLNSIKKLASIDLYIGEPEYLSKGYGQKIIKLFLHTYVKPYYDACLVDPDSENVVATKCFKKVGFEQIAKLNLSNNRQATIMLIYKANM